MRFPKFSKNRRGFALLLTVLGAMAVVILAAEFHFTSWVEGAAVRYHLDGLRASALARSGVELAMYIINEDEREDDSFDDLWAKLDQQAAAGVPIGPGLVTIRIADESNKININKADISEVKTIFKLLSVNREKKGEITGLIMQGMDLETSLKKIMNTRPLTHLSAIAKETGNEGFQDGPGISSCLTVWGDGAINVNTATETVLFALKPFQDLGAPERLVASLVENRPFKNTDEAVAVLKQQVEVLPEGLSKALTVKSTFFRITATGMVRDVRVSVEAVVERTENDHLKIMSWSE